NTPLNLAICRHNGTDSGWEDMTAWVESLQQALQTGATYSAGFPISSRQDCNAIGQKYYGPVVLVTDALCYSTTDIFSAGFQDHEIGPVIGTSANTGAGGANVWEYDAHLMALLPEQFPQLPRRASMRVAVRRTTRVGKRAGDPI